jgi:hypothetical protein
MSHVPRYSFSAESGVRIDTFGGTGGWVASEHYDQLVKQVREHEKWLAERVDWLKYEMDHGGDWKYLQLKREETLYCLEKFRAHVQTQTESQT